MLRANVNVSRKLSKDDNSTGFSVSLDAEIMASLDDPEAVLERIKELYDLAEEALDRKVSEAREIDALARRDAEDRPEAPANGRDRDHHPDDPAGPSSRNGRHKGPKPDNDEPATNKQVQFLTSLAKRQKLSGPKLEAFIAEVIGRDCSPYDLSKKEAGRVIDALNPEAAGENRARR